MRRFALLLMACALAVLLIGPMPAQASSATVVFSGPDKVKAGQTYTYTYRIEVKDVAAARIVPITAGGGFELVSGGEGLLYDTIPDNTSGSTGEGTVVVKVKSSAKPGDKCTLSTSGDYAVIVIKDGQYGTSPDYVFSGSLVAVVTAGTSEEPVATPSPTPRPSATAGPSATPTPAPTPAATLAPAATPGPVSGDDTSGAAASQTSDADVATQDSAVTTAEPKPSGGQTPAPMVSIVPEDTAADADRTGSVSTTVIVAVIVAVALAAVALVYFMRRRQTGGPGPGRDATAVADDETDSRVMRRAYRSKKYKRYRR